MKPFGFSSQLSPFSMTRVRAEICNFKVGQPGRKLIPKRMLDDALTHTLSTNNDPFIYQYPTFDGPIHVRLKLAQFLSNSGKYPSNIHPDSICLSFGNSHAISLIVRVLTRPGDVVIVEELTYFLIYQILKDAHLTVHLCPMSETGIDIDKLSLLVDKFSPKLVYVNPIHQNPLGTCLSVSDRNRLVALSEQKDFLIVSDEPYVLLDFESSEQTRSLSRMNSHRVICCGTFSKLIAPGLRCGWILAAPDLVRKFCSEGAMHSGGGPPSLISQTVCSLIETGQLESHRIELCAQLAARRDAMLHALAASTISRSATWTVPAGGYFVYLKFNQLNTETFLQYVIRKDIPVRFLQSAACSSSEVTNGLRLSFSFYDTDEISLGIQILASALEEFLLVDTTA